MHIEVQDQRDVDRYEVTVDGTPAGVLTYRLETEHIAFPHAVVYPEFGGQGVGSALAAYALDDARTRGLAVLPDCPFLSAYIEKHPEYLDLVPAELRRRYGLG